MRRFVKYLRTHRRRWHLTQGELAFLFGYSDQSMIARLERGERALSLAVAHACELIFGVEWDEIFPELLATIEERVVHRLRELADQLGQAEATKKTAPKLKLLRGALNRIGAADQHKI
jgi:transcriptional regulator with XRE-family HTH domain